MYRALLSAITPGQSGPVNNGNKGVLHTLQSSRITGASPLDCLVSYPKNTLGESYPSADMQSVYAVGLADWATRWGSLTSLQRYNLWIL